MIQKKPDLLEYITGGLGGDTQISDIVLDGYNSINIISFNQLQSKYNDLMQQYTNIQKKIGDS